MCGEGGHVAPQLAVGEVVVGHVGARLRSDTHAAAHGARRTLEEVVSGGGGGGSTQGLHTHTHVSTRTRPGHVHARISAHTHVNTHSCMHWH